MNKPPYVYHASSDRNIEIFEPRMESFRDPNEGPVVFATANKIYASMFMTSTNDNWAMMGFFNEIPYFICSDKEKFLSLDKGGAIYKLPSDTFEYDPIKGGKTRQEYTSKTSVKPMDKEEYTSSLQTMKDIGVKVYFVDKDSYRKIGESSDNGWSILEKLSPEN